MKSTASGTCGRNTLRVHTIDFDYALPPSRIAQNPAEPRDHSRLLALDRPSRTIAHRRFFHIVDYLRPGDLLVWNNSKVFKARLFGRLLSADGAALREHAREIEIFLVRPTENHGVWQVLAKPGRHVESGMRVEFAPDFFCEVLMKEKNGLIAVQFAEGVEGVRGKANRYGHIPVPPYVKDEPHELESYQTVYARHEGSVAAPTAGFHFTEKLIQSLKRKGVEFADVTLHVGLGTFLPVKAERIEDHTMHSEWIEVTEESAAAINRARQEGRRVVAVGTTTVRTLEGIAAMHGGRLAPYRGEMNLFIKSGFSFQAVDAMITNFHLPKSTLLMLVSAFVGDRQFTLECYKKAVEEQYRFFSFGDAMFIQ